MDNINNKFANALTEAEKHWRNADHMVYVIIPVVKDSKLLLRALESLYKSLVLNISTILKFEYLYKRVELTNNPKRNLEIFFKKCAFKYGMNENERENIKKLLFFGKKHKVSGFEFSKSGKVIILDDAMSVSELSINLMKEFLQVSKKLLEKTQNSFN